MVLNGFVCFVCFYITSWYPCFFLFFSILYMRHATNERNDILLLAEQLNHMVCSQNYEIVHRKTKYVV